MNIFKYACFFQVWSMIIWHSGTVDRQCVWLGCHIDRVLKRSNFLRNKGIHGLLTSNVSGVQCSRDWEFQSLWSHLAVVWLVEFRERALEHLYLGLDLIQLSEVVLVTVLVWKNKLFNILIHVLERVPWSNIPLLWVAFADQVWIVKVSQC